MEKQSKCTKCGVSFDYHQNLKGYSPVTILQFEYCPRCLSQAVNVENALKIYQFNELMLKEKKENEKKENEKKTLWQNIWPKKEKRQESDKS